MCQIQDVLYSPVEIYINKTQQLLLCVNPGDKEPLLVQNKINNVASNG
jgi:hypothetical protein